MNDYKIDPEKLTAYALDELDEPKRIAIAAQLEHDESAQREVTAIRDMASHLKEQLAREALPEQVAKTLKLPRRPRWGARLAVAAAVALVVGGLAFSILAPKLNRARETARRTDGFDQRAPAPEIEKAGAPVVAAPPPAMQQSVSARQPIDAPSTVPPVAMATTPAPESYAMTAGTDAKSPAEQPPAPTLSLQAGASESESARPTAARRFAAEVSGRAPAARGTHPDLATVSTESQARSADPAPVALEHQTSLEKVLHPDGGFNTEAYDRIQDNPFREVMQNPLSTFSIDVDTASYSNVRRFLMSGQRPPKDAVRIEELINYFPYDYAPPAKNSADPFAANVEVASCPWNDAHRLVRVGLKGKEIAADKRPASNLVFLLDVSGSMKPENKLPLVRRAMRMLLEQLNGEDRVAIVVYAGSSGLVLSSTTCTDANKTNIFNAISNLEAGGSTNGEQGIQLAYTVAKQNFIDGGTNRVILCTDGDFNVGVTNQGDLTRIIEEKAKAGVFLSVLGFGMGNLKDSTMEKLADKGNGNYAYIDTISEAKKVLVEQMSGTLVTIAKDVKIQIEFNPAVVSSYRLIGYENRMLAKEDFNDDKKDAGEIGAGHAVTALYEVSPVDGKRETQLVDELKYQKSPATAQVSPAHGPGYIGEMLTLKLRYKQPEGETSKLLEVPVTDDGASFAKSSTDFKFASAVAAFGMILRNSPHKGTASLNAVLEWAEDGVAKDASGYRQEFVELVRKAQQVGAGKE